MRRALRGIAALFTRLPRDARAPVLAQYLAAHPPLRLRSGAPVIAVQCVEDPTFMAVLAAQARTLAAREGAAVDVLLVRSICGGIGRGLRAFLLRSSPIAWLRMRQWQQVLAPLAPRVAYRSRSWGRPFGDLVDLGRSYGAWRRACRAQGDLRLEIDGIRVDDLVIDSCLRFSPTPRFDVRQRFVWALIWQAYRDVHRARAYFDTRRPAVYLTSYTTYVEHGIAVRAALQAGVPVRAFGNLNAFGVSVTTEHWFHTTDTSRYAATFSLLPDPTKALAAAEQGLKTRLAGGIDPATAYMRASAYAAGEDAVAEGVRGAVVVFLHDFYDSPHVYADLVFQDFWAWITCTIETLQAQGTSFFLKPHPNQISLSEGVLADLKRAYPSVKFLPSSASNVRLVEQGMVCGVTVYGTVAHELAYLGVPTIACARHPHHSFGFCRTARSVDEYRTFLGSPAERACGNDEMRRQALAFYYMHNLHGEPHARELRTRFVEFWKVSESASPSPSAWRESLECLVDAPGFVVTQAIAAPATRLDSCVC
jgi:hypothetical protein